jgi:hypothetical protein
MTRRDPWAILYTSLVFGGIFVPYWYTGLFFYISLYLRVPLLNLGPTGFILLGASTVLVLSIFVAPTQVEQRLRQRLGRFFSPLRALLLVLAAGELALTTLANMNPFLMTLSGTWSNFIEIATISAVVAAVIVVARPASRLERSIAIRLDRANPRHHAYRAAGYVVLTSGFLFASYWIYQSYLYERYCVGYIEQQDYIDCHFLH